MYAMTATSYRAINSADDAASGETIVTELPQSLLDTIAGEERRGERNARLRACDWTQVPDTPLNIADKTAWAVYRQRLRDLPAQTGWPNTNWPDPPGLPVGAAGSGGGSV